MLSDFGQMETRAMPESIERVGESGLRIAWTDGVVSDLTAAKLRKACPCATCKEKRSADEAKASAPKPLTLPVLSAAELAPLRVVSMAPVGNYAYNIEFSDGHGSGLFGFDLLRSLG